MLFRSGADKLGDAGEPVLVEVFDGAVVQELTRREQRSVHVRGGATGVGRQTSWGQRRGGGAAFPRTEGCRDEACCSFPARPVAASVAGDGERWGRPPTGAVWATQAARAARRSAQARRVSAMDMTEDQCETTEERFRRTSTWHAKCQMLGSGRPLRYKLWGAREDLSPTYSRLEASQGI